MAYMPKRKAHRRNRNRSWIVDPRPLWIEDSPIGEYFVFSRTPIQLWISKIIQIGASVSRYPVRPCNTVVNCFSIINVI